MEPEPQFGSDQVPQPESGPAVALERTEDRSAAPSHAPGGSPPVPAAALLAQLQELRTRKDLLTGADNKKARQKLNRKIRMLEAELNGLYPEPSPPQQQPPQQQQPQQPRQQQQDLGHAKPEPAAPEQRSPSRPACARCSDVPLRPQWCKGCRSVSYCSDKCQKNDWGRTNGHKMDCERLKRNRQDSRRAFKSAGVNAKDGRAGPTDGQNIGRLSEPRLSTATGSSRVEKVLALVNTLVKPGKVNLEQMRNCMIAIKALIVKHQDAAYAFIYGEAPNEADTPEYLPHFRTAEGRAVRAGHAGLRWLASRLATFAAEEDHCNRLGTQDAPNSRLIQFAMLQLFADFVAARTIPIEQVLAKPWMLSHSERQNSTYEQAIEM